MSCTSLGGKAEKIKPCVKMGHQGPGGLCATAKGQRVPEPMGCHIRVPRLPGSAHRRSRVCPPRLADRFVLKDRGRPLPISQGGSHRTSGLRRGYSP